MIARHAGKMLTAALAGLAAVLGPLSVPPADAQPAPRPFDHAGLARQALEGHILPGYGRLAKAATELAQTLDRECTHLFDKRPPAVDAAFDELVAAWGGIEHITFGPVTTDNRLERILFFPDRRGLGGRQVARALATRDPAVTEASTLAKRSVALQGLGALDVVLYDLAQSPPDTPEQRAHRCGYARAMAANIAALSQAVLAEWSQGDGYRHHWLNAGRGSRTFVKPFETTLALAKAFKQGLERIRDDRLATALGLGRQRRKLPAVLDKSDRTLLLLSANLDGLIELYEAGGMHRAIAPPQVPDTTDGFAAKARLVASELRTARAVVAELLPVRSPFTNISASRRMISVGFPLKNARDIAHQILTLAAGLPPGFNASDGD